MIEMGHPQLETTRGDLQEAIKAPKYTDLTDDIIYLVPHDMKLYHAQILKSGELKI